MQEGEEINCSTDPIRSADRPISVRLCTCNVQQLIDPVVISCVKIYCRDLSDVIVIILIFCIDKKKKSATTLNHCRPNFPRVDSKTSEWVLPPVSSASEITCHTFKGNHEFRHSAVNTALQTSWSRSYSVFVLTKKSCPKAASAHSCSSRADVRRNMFASLRMASGSAQSPSK